METDKDHIHYMIETEPNINLSDLVRTMKAYTIIYGNCIKNIYLNNFGENTPFGQMDILFVVLEMSVSNN